jgi:hypothetical protein
MTANTNENVCKTYPRNPDKNDNTDKTQVKTYPVVCVNKSFDADHTDAPIIDAIDVVVETIKLFEIILYRIK